jgi:magnesium-transporting ATPase (P-type)
MTSGISRSRSCFNKLQATPAGLSADEASRRLRLYGPNTLAPESRFVLLVSFFRFFANPLVIILVVAAGVSFALGEHIGAAIIIAIVVFSVLLNFLMEFQAHHAVDEIRKQIAITAIVIRDGREQELPVTDLVAGDVIRLKAGDLVPADARLLTVKDLQVRESALTGESLRVEKTAIELSDDKHGSVATFHRGQIIECAHVCSGCQIEEVVDELNLPKQIISCHPSNLPLPDHVDCFVALNGSLGRLESSEALFGVHSTFDGSMILSEDIIQVLHGSVSTTMAQSPFLLTVGDRGAVDRRQVGVDYSRLWMGSIAERLAKQALGSICVTQR